MSSYGPQSYFSLGRVYPRDRLRDPYPRARRRLLVALFGAAPPPPPLIFRRTTEAARTGSRSVQG